jgi:hypothetical protein
MTGDGWLKEGERPIHYDLVYYNLHGEFVAHQNVHPQFISFLKWRKPPTIRSQSYMIMYRSRFPAIQKGQDVLPQMLYHITAFQ